MCEKFKNTDKTFFHKQHMCMSIYDVNAVTDSEEHQYD